MSENNSSTDLSNNNQDFQTFLQSYLSDLIQTPPPLVDHISSSQTSPFAQYINPLHSSQIHQRARRMPLNLFVPDIQNIPFQNQNQIMITETSGVSNHRLPRIHIRTPNRNTIDTDWGDFLESILQRPPTRGFASHTRRIPYLDQLLQRSFHTAKKKYKKVLSDKGKEQIKRVPFEKDIFNDQLFCAKP